MYSKSQVRAKYGCESDKRCGECKKVKICTSSVARQYRTFYHTRDRELDKKYYCDIVHGRCMKSMCSRYEQCIRPAKTNYETWIKAYMRDNKKLLEQLSTGGIINGD